MEAVPRIPMISFDLKVSTEPSSFGTSLKHYITEFYGEDPDAYDNEINTLESLRSSAVRPSTDVAGCQLIKKYYCQLQFLRSRFPMEESQPAAVYFAWKDNYSSLSCSVPDIRFEIMCVLYNIGALHTILGSSEPRNSHDGMKIACTHFQCAAWAFQIMKETYYQMVTYISSIDVVNFMQLIALAQAQECILEKSMMDGRKATITAKVAVQVVDFYKRALASINFKKEDNTYNDYVKLKTVKEWINYIHFKLEYYKCISLLFQGEQAEEQQKMGERVAFYQAASDHLEAARKLSSNLENKQELIEALAFTLDVVEGKKKAAKNENEFIYHEEVPNREALQEVKGAALVKGIPINVNDVEVSGNDIFARLVPMAAHEASSLYSEKKAEMLRQYGELIENKDQALVEFLSSMQLEVITEMRQATGLSQDLIDRAAALSARPNAIKDLIAVMGKLSNSYEEVDSMLNEIQELLRIEEENEAEYQKTIGERPPSIVATDLSREAAKYRDAHQKANDSNQALHKAMTLHVTNLKILSKPLMDLKNTIPSVQMPDRNIDEVALRDIESLLSKVEEMRKQRALLWAQLRDAVHKDDITGVLVTRSPSHSLEKIFREELQKHQQLTNVIDQNVVAQENILKAVVEAYARFATTAKYLHGIISQRNAMVQSVINSFDTYEDLLAKANKGIEFYTKLETNVTKLLQRIRSVSKVQEEEREQVLANLASRNAPQNPRQSPQQQQLQSDVSTSGPKLRDYLDSMKKNPPPPSQSPGLQYSNPRYANSVSSEIQRWPPGVRPTPVGSEVTDVAPIQYDSVGYINPVADINQPVYHNNPTIRRMLPQVPVNNFATTPQYASEINDFNSTNVNYGLAEKFATLNTGGNNPGPSLPKSGSYANYQDYQDSNVYKYNQDSMNSQGVTNPVYSNAQQYVPQTNYKNTVMNNENTNLNSPSFAESYAPQATYATGQYGVVDISNNYSGYEQPNQYAIPQETYTNQYASVGTLYNPASPQAYLPSGGTTNTLGYQETFQQYQMGPGSSTPNYTYTTVSSNNQVPQEPTYNAGYAVSAGLNEVQRYPQADAEYYSTYEDGKAMQNYGESTAGYNSQYSEGYVGPGAISHNNYNPNSMYTQAGNYTYSTNDTNYSAGGVQSPQSYTPEDANVPNPLQNYSYIPNNIPVNNDITSTQPPAKTSNLDLLMDLDFSVSQPPLIPQQNKSNVVEQEKPSVAPPKENIVQQQEKPKTAKPIEKILPKKPLDNSEVRKLYAQEVDKYEKFVEMLSNKTLNGPTNLDLKWKEIQEKQDSDGGKKIISVARCYPAKNRFPDILPYDFSRVQLESTGDDYINASFIKDISPFVPTLVVTQAPLASTISDFWTMIREQNVEFVMCLLNDNEIGEDVYWPKEKGRDLHIPNFVIGLQSVIVKAYWTERLISITVPDKRESTTIMHMQFTDWPGSLFPTNPEPFVHYTKEVITLYQQQRLHSHPILVHCSSGIGRSGLACLLISAILDATNNPVSVPDLTTLTHKITSFRKNILRDREHLKFAYQSFLCYMKIMTIKETKSKQEEENLKVDSSQSPVVKDADPLNTLDPFWASKKGT